jgi:hypothetical protein
MEGYEGLARYRIRVLVYMVVVSVQLLRANDIWATSGRVASSDA